METSASADRTKCAAASFQTQHLTAQSPRALLVEDRGNRSEMAGKEKVEAVLPRAGLQG